MKLVVVGGQCRNLGKTSLVCEMVRELADLDWTAVKIEQSKPGDCPVDGRSCGCGADEHGFVILEERDAAGRGDSSRFLAAGAARSLWVRVKPGKLSAAWLELRRVLGDAAHVIVESTSLVEMVDPDLYLLVLDPPSKDFKESARRNLARADAVILRAMAEPASAAGMADSLLGGKKKFLLPAGHPASAELLELVRARVLAGSLRR